KEFMSGIFETALKMVRLLPLSLTDLTVRKAAFEPIEIRPEVSRLIVLMADAKPTRESTVMPPEPATIDRLRGPAARLSSGDESVSWKPLAVELPKSTTRLLLSVVLPFKRSVPADAPPDILIETMSPGFVPPLKTMPAPPIGTAAPMLMLPT